MATKNPLVSIVVLNWNGLEDTKLCIENVRKLTYANYELIVVDNGSKEEDKAYLSSLKDIVYIDNPVNRGFTGGHIDGYKKSNGEYILLLNNDAVIKTDYIEKALLAFDDEQVAAVGGRSYFWNEQETIFDETNQFFSYMILNPYTGETTLQKTDDNVCQEVNTLSGAAVILKKSVIEEVGYLYNPFFAYYEETDLFARMKRAGYKVMYNPELKIWHRNGASSGSQAGSYFFFYHIFRNRFIFALRNLDAKFLPAFLKNYYLLGLKSVGSIVRGEEQKRLGIAYAKAILFGLAHLPSLLQQRRQLKLTSINSDYGEQILEEQIKYSVVSFRNNTLTEARKDKNPFHEYVFLGKPNETEPSNIRFVEDKKYFDTLPANLGCIISKMPWLVLIDSELPSQNITKLIRQAEREGKKVINLGGSILAISRDYYQKVGGLQGDSYVVATKRIISLASLERLLLDQKGFYSNSTHSLASKKLIEDMTYNNFLQKGRHRTKWQFILERHHRISQLNNLLVWLATPTIPLRLKAGRVRNLLLFSLKANTKALALELRHIVNERQRYGKERSILALSEKHTMILKNATENAIQHPENLPVFVICYQRIEDLKKLVNWLKTTGIQKIVFIDNNSEYPPLLNYYAKSPYQVLSLQRNVGHTAPWSLDIIRILCPYGYYIVTDPDVIPVDYMPKNPLRHLAQVHKDFFAYKKVGFGLKIDDLPRHYPLRDSVVQWESQFWKTQLSDGVFEAGVDTTFAMYKPFTYNYMLHPSIRTDEPYVARHVPWYVNPQEPDDEEIFYRSKSNKSITSWNVDELPERYKKELNKKKP